MKTLALAIVALLFVVTCEASLPADCEEVTYETRVKTVQVRCTQIVERVDCTEQQVGFKIPVDTPCDPSEEPAPDGSEPGEKVCDEPSWEDAVAVVRVRCTNLIVVTTCEPREIEYQHPIDSPGCENVAPAPQARSSTATTSVSIQGTQGRPAAVGYCQPCSPIPQQGCRKCGLFH